MKSSMSMVELFDYSEVPRELLQNATGGEVHLNMEDHRHEEFLPQKTKVKAFGGKDIYWGVHHPLQLALLSP
ncbi:NSFL1 cofactor p47-like [Homalodisca vitripennis]|uniref:NSFL1 cofactor p47-like n=1 Tax=Homalodisca vitripennis TaxID=197043 RepID=UPI001EEAA8D3|nr:NSFL1 cofactor p47-like [Homalodisca vitripennis]